MSMKCPNCTKEIPNDSIFCEWCGIKIQDVVKLNVDEDKVKHFLERNAKLFPKKKISWIQEQLLKVPYEQLESILSCDYEKVYRKAYKIHIVCGFVLQVLTIPILIILYYNSSLYFYVDEFVDTLIVSAIVGISFLCYMLFPSPKKKVYTLFEKKLHNK